MAAQLDARAVRDRLDKALRREVPDWLWEEFEDEGAFEDVHETWFSDLVTDARERLAAERRRAERRGREHVVTESNSPPSRHLPALRAAALSDALAARADERPDVREIRARPLRFESVADVDRYVATTEDRQLRRVAARLADRFGWSPSDAVYFLLLRKVPSVPAQEARVSTDAPESARDGRGYVAIDYVRTRVTITADAWVHADDVAALYRVAQRWALPRLNRPISERVLQAYRFVEARRRTTGSETPAASLDAWNASELGQRPGWAFRDAKDLQRALRRAERLLLYPETKGAPRLEFRVIPRRR